MIVRPITETVKSNREEERVSERREDVHLSHAFIHLRVGWEFGQLFRGQVVLPDFDFLDGHLLPDDAHLLLRLDGLAFNLCHELR